MRATQEGLPPDEELATFGIILARRFIQRWDLQARQRGDGRYVCIKEPLHTEHLLAHLQGTITLGTYVLDPDSRARFVALDADDEAGRERLGSLARRLAEKGVPAYLEDSRRGGHLWLFLAQTTAGRDARAFGQGLLAAHQIEGVELFPRQDRLGGGPGSLIRLPFGVHRLTNQHYGFLTPDGQPLAPTLRAQIEALNEAQSVPEAAFEAYRSLFAPPRPPSPLPERLKVSGDYLSERIKASVGVRQFVERYVDLSPSGVGLCPFHDDQHASFAVNEAGNYWHCFAGCGGGSIIDFWMRWRERQGKDSDFIATLTELARMLEMRL